MARKKSINFEKPGYDKYLYTGVLINIILIFTWYIPRGAILLSSYSLGQHRFEKVVFVVINGLIGLTGLIFAIVLSMQIYYARTSAKTPTEFYLRRKNILSKLTFIFWVIIFLLGLLLYITTYF